jgi:hypothetical protein
MTDPAGSPELEQLARVARALIMTDAPEVLALLHCPAPLCQAQANGLLAMADWTEGDVIVAALLGYDHGE